MIPPLPLAAASQRLRGKPGRPRAQANATPQEGRAVPLSLSFVRGLERAALSPEARLLDLAATAVYLGLSPWTVRSLEAAGTLKRVRVPVCGGGDLRKLLFDRQDLDRLVETWKT
jgi:hypothetical protein